MHMYDIVSVMFPPKNSALFSGLVVSNTMIQSTLHTSASETSLQKYFFWYYKIHRYLDLLTLNLKIYVMGIWWFMHAFFRVVTFWPAMEATEINSTGWPKKPLRSMTLSCPLVQGNLKEDLWWLSNQPVDHRKHVNMCWWYCWWFRNPVISPVEVGSLYHYIYIPSA